MSGFDYEKDADGVVTVTMDMTGPVNAMNAEYRKLMGVTLDRLEGESGLTGVVFASAKNTFFAGGDLHELLTAKPGEEEAFFASLERVKGQLRRLEKLPVPVVAAINGAALGGGYEIALAANHRIVVDDPAAVVGLPEVTLGLLPGGGGVVRMVHRLGAEKALPYLLEGKRVRPAEALKAGLVEATVTDLAALIPAAKAWIKANPDAAVQPWDCKGHKVPGANLLQAEFGGWLAGATAALSKNTRGLLPAPERILAIAAEATVLGFDAALRLESRGLTYLVTTPQAKNLITTMFFQLNRINGGASRPQDVPRGKIARMGILGAGMMGQGIAYEAAKAGIEVVLRDVSLEAAENGKAYTERLLAAQASKGRISTNKAEAILARIKPTAQAEDLAGVDLIVEAVFESIELKAQVTQETERYLAEGGVFGSNTSTLPITTLATAAQHPENFIGIHFFSPVDKMPLVEIICGEQTSPHALARAFDFARQIGKTPIVVNDSLGFFTSRTFGTYLDEGARLLKEGVAAASIENLARQVGMPVGPLAVQDEVSQELTRKAAETQRAMGLFGSKADNSVCTELAERLISEFGRGGRAHGGGYYDYPADGQKTLWPALGELYGRPGLNLPAKDIQDRILFRQVIESVKCLEEGVLRSVADGNIGSIMGIGAPAWTGGWLQFVNTYGVDAFIKRAGELAEVYGSRFAPPALLLQKAAAGQSLQDGE